MPARQRERYKADMKSHTEYLTFNVPARRDFVNITREVEEAMQKSGLREGLVLCNAKRICVQSQSARSSRELQRRPIT